MEKQLPNLFTLCNLFCGFFGIISCMNGNLELAGLLVFIGAGFDLLDGLTARLLKAYSPIGKQLDSLTDIVTFGILPALIMHILLLKTHQNWLYVLYLADTPSITLLPFLIAGCAAWRLAKFNIDESQSTSFKGLPTPASAMFFASLPLIMGNDAFVVKYDVYYFSTLILNPYLLGALILLFSWLMISTLPLFSFKLNGFGWQQNKPQLILAGLSIVLFAFLLWAAIPVIIFLYLILSFIFKAKPQNEIQSAD